ncbi:MAG: type IV pilin N-terminal domain-containing protein [Archaeoglobus sp.]|nr:type IV pilin N-terminal domain-containing protein [Archaeoglobus sp.]
MWRKDEKAVSPVIGVILMVAITVILAAVIASFVFGMGSNVKKTYVVSATASRLNSSAVQITYQGGPDHQFVTGLVIQSPSGCTGLTNTVGDTATCTSGVASSNQHVVVVANFTDGSQQVILDTYV